MEKDKKEYRETEENDSREWENGDTPGTGDPDVSGGETETAADYAATADASGGKAAELAELKDKYLRLVAEFDNYRKRTSRERVTLIQTANKEVIISLLDIIDDFERALQQMEQSDNIALIHEGIGLIFNKLKSTLQAKGLREMESLHADFDTDLHEAVTEIPAPSEELKGKVVDNLQKGYYLNDQIIRHAKVVVGK
ncbi:nucleotide exchange factor GrpE [Compostibacter hankyongensis]|uniref:Protein GrpE n=1 Tax=Compostibacter hankyongensis TaxID=1007089 RepID=A0ABP8FYU0_9BACT